MNPPDVHLLDLPNEILLIILRKLNNIDVLYSLLDINNGQLDILAQEKTFTNVLNFVHTDNISLIDRFCIYILPRIHHNIKYFILEPVFMGRILLAAVYPNLTELKLFNFERQIASKYFTGQNRIIDGTCVQDDILVYMPQLHSFTFYISTYIDSGDLRHNIARQHINQTLINIGPQNATTIVNRLSRSVVECSIFSLPFAFDYLGSLGNTFPNIVFNYITYIVV
ncbi:unnamed protein product [Rotaria magnacalcarata]|uniref:F-box domain-containing protein n=1 Tax=Rotaria magnacalcarata TaxID=392030 RepID=A0A816X168_9BILA|nr:unnamed protein product [Rotaria magnacalcarata]CAF4268516.1 unnamed protein product [Rotaria magnacalcarata]